MKSIAAILFLLFFFKVDAQQPLTDSAFYVQSLYNASTAYKKQVQENLHIFNGIEYLRANHGVKGTAFFETDSLLPGAVFYDGRLYENTPMHYDIVSDNVVVDNFTHSNELMLVPEKVGYFFILQHLFVRITADSSLPSGFRIGT